MNLEDISALQAELAADNEDPEEAFQILEKLGAGYKHNQTSVT